MAQEEAQDEGDLGQQVRAGLRWSLINTIFGRGAGFAAGVVLARILAPKDFGVFTVALVVVTLLLSLNDVGVSTAIVRWQGDLEEITATGTTLIFVFSLLLYAGMFVSAPWLSSALRTPGATGVVRLLSFGVVIDAIFAVPSVLLTRSLRQDRRALCDTTVFVVTTSVTVVLALQGHGAWSLAWGRLIGNLIGGLVILAVTRAKIRPGFDWSVAKHLISFGAPLMGADLLVFAMLNVDNLIVGRVLGATELGLYVLAFNLSGWPVNVLSDTVRRVSLVAFSRLRMDPAAVRSGLVRSVAILLAVTIPVCGLLAILAHPLIDFVYGGKWLGATRALQFLSVLGACRVFIELVSDYLIALGRPKTILLLQAVWVAALVPVLIVGAHYRGIVGVGMGHMVVAGGLMIPLFLIALRSTGVELRSLLQRVLLPLVAAAASLGTAAVLLHVLTGQFLQLSICGTAAVIVFALIVYPGRASLLGADTLAPGAPAPEA
jgi:O-antigen/teichoic acid export membrane protein